jgi:hypothetical protein
MPKTQDPHMARSGNRHPYSGYDEVEAGDVVLADDGMLGHVDHIIRSETSAPVYLVVSVRRRLWRRYPVVPWALVTGVDERRHRVQVWGALRALREMPETLPLVL